MKAIQVICDTGKDSFFDVKCEHYDLPRYQCNLLSQKRMNEIFEIGRCVFSIVDFVQKEILGKFTEKFGGVHEGEDFRIEKMIKRLKRVQWEDSLSIRGWMTYLQITARRIVINILIRRKLLPHRKVCGTCREWLRSRPHTCQVSGERKNRTDVACDLYRFSVTTSVTVLEGDGDDSGDNTEVNLFPAAIEKSEEAQKEIANKLDVERLRVELKKRVEAEKNGTKRKAILIRQYDLLVTMHRLLAEGHADKEVFQMLSKSLGISEKGVRRDLADIRQFLSSRLAGY